MPVVVKNLTRVFRFEGTEFADPLPGESEAKCLEVLAVSYPKLNNAECETPVTEGGKRVFNIKAEYGTKG